MLFMILIDGDESQLAFSVFWNIRLIILLALLLVANGYPWQIESLGFLPQGW